MNTPLISIIIPVYGVEKYIEKCLRSCFDNTIAKSCEFLIIDDCSPDKSITIAKQLIEKYKDLDIQIIQHKENRGLAAARNTGLLNAKGEYIINVDSDDWVEPNYLELLYNESKSSDSDVICCNLIKEFNDHSQKEKMYVPENPEIALSYLLTGKVLGYTPLRLIKKELFTKNNFSWIEGLNMCEDLLIMVKVFTYAKKISFIDEYLYHYNCNNNNSLSAGLNDNKISQLINVSYEIEKCIKEHNQYEKYYKELLTQKTRFKIWITKCAIEKKTDYFKLYENEKLYKDKYSSLLIRLYLLCCNLHFFKCARLMIYTKSFFEKSK